MFGIDRVTYALPVVLFFADLVLLSEDEIFEAAVAVTAERKEPQA